MLEEIAAFCKEHETEGYILTHPDASFEEIVAYVRELEQAYFPGMNAGDLEELYAEGNDLFRDMVIYMFPRYVMSYALSTVCAMQFYELFQKDAAAAVAQYDALCRKGGSLSYPALMSAIGMKLPYEDGCIEALCRFAREELKRLEEKL